MTAPVLDTAGWNVDNVFIPVAGSVTVDSGGATPLVAPTSISSAIVGGTNLGYMTEDGAPTITPERDGEEIRLWQYATVADTDYSSSAIVVVFTCAESKKEVLEYVWNAKFDQADGSAVVDVSASAPAAKTVVDVVSKKGQGRRFYLSKARLTEIAEITNERGTISGYQCTVRGDFDPELGENGKGGHFKYWDSSVTTPPPAWSATTAYALGNRVTLGAGVVEATSAGTSGSTAPTLPAAVGGTVTDGTVTWTRRS